MNDLFWLTEAQIDRLRSYFPKSRGKPRVDDRRVLNGIIFIQRNGLMWKHAPAAYGPPKTLYNRWKRWSRMGVFATIYCFITKNYEAPARLWESCRREVRAFIGLMLLFSSPWLAQWWSVVAASGASLDGMGVWTAT